MSLSLYKISIIKPTIYDVYGTYTEAIVAATSENDARCIHPNPKIFIDEYTDLNGITGEVWMYSDILGGSHPDLVGFNWVPFNKRDQVKVEQIILSDQPLNRGVVSCKFIPLPSEKIIDKNNEYLNEIMRVLRDDPKEFKLLKNEEKNVKKNKSIREKERAKKIK